jgi:hypothetical protein
VNEAGDLDEWAVVTAALGLRASFQRCIEGYRNQLVPRQEVVGVSTVEFVNWACALDELLEGTDNTYAERRDQHQDGRLILALRFVRDRHMHQVVVSSRLVFTLTGSYDGSMPPTITQAKIYWRPIEEIREPTDGREDKDLYRSRRTAYVEYLAGREPPLALGLVNNFLFDEIKRREIDVPLITDLGLDFVLADHD